MKDAVRMKMKESCYCVMDVILVITHIAWILHWMRCHQMAGNVNGTDYFMLQFFLKDFLLRNGIA